nr:uncharacterized protein LOC126521829 [Dermacentor andersoni]
MATVNGKAEKRIGLSCKKMKRMESKKRKIEAFLQLCEDKSSVSPESATATKKRQNSDKTWAHEKTSVSERKTTDLSDAAKTISEELVQLRARKRPFPSAWKEMPKFFLTDDGTEAAWAWPETDASADNDDSEDVVEDKAVLYLQDIQALLLVALMGQKTPILTRWCRYLRNEKTSHIVVITVSGLSAKDLSASAEQFPKLRNIFPDGGVRVVPSARYGATTESELTQVPISLTSGMKLRCFFGSLEAAESAGAVYRCYGAFVPIEKPDDKETSGKNEEPEPSDKPSAPKTSDVTAADAPVLNQTVAMQNKSTNKNAKSKKTQPLDSKSPEKLPAKEVPTEDEDIATFEVPRTFFLLSPVQMLTEGYPLIRANNTRDYVYTKSSYTPVNHNSRLFGLDCEMCLTTARVNELTRVAMVDEEENVLLDELVKPRNRIINYLTQFSGITKEMLDPVWTRIEDVQKAISDLLPSDAILVGQSLNCDLHALHLIHPYVIDSSVIYNVTGNRRIKTKLKTLTSTFLGEEIQTGTDGHCSAEDAIASLRLVKHRLKQGLFYGDAVLKEMQKKIMDRALEIYNRKTQFNVFVYDEDEMGFGSAGKKREEYEPIGVYVYDEEELESTTVAKTPTKPQESPSKQKELTVWAKCRKQLQTDFRGAVSNLFYYLNKRENRRLVHLVGKKEVLGNYPKFVLKTTPHTQVDSNKEVARSVRSLMETNQIVMAGLQAQDSNGQVTKEKAAEVDKLLRKIYRNCRKACLFVVFLEGSVDVDTQVTQHGLCFVKVKEAEKRPLKEDCSVED